MKGQGGRIRAGRARLALAGLAAGGTMAGHWVAYAVREPDAGARAVLLEATGHHLLPQLSVVALFAALVALAGMPRGRPGPPLSYWSAARALVALQAGGFTALEAGERLFAHGHGLSLADLTEPALAIGLGAQVVIGCAAAALVVGLGKLALRAADPPPAIHVPFPPSRPAAARRQADRPGDDAHPLRGPPRLSRT